MYVHSWVYMFCYSPYFSLESYGIRTITLCVSIRKVTKAKDFWNVGKGKRVITEWVCKLKHNISKHHSLSLHLQILWWSACLNLLDPSIFFFFCFFFYDAKGWQGQKTMLTPTDAQENKEDPGKTQEGYNLTSNTKQMEAENLRDYQKRILYKACAKCCGATVL